MDELVNTGNISVYRSKTNGHVRSYRETRELVITEWIELTYPDVLGVGHHTTLRVALVRMHNPA